MKSKQLNFFITPDDYCLISQFLNDFKCELLIDRCGKSKIIKINNLNQLETGVFQLFLCPEGYGNKVFTTGENDLEHINIFNSYVVQFSLGGFYPYDKNILQKGRLFFTQGFFEGENFVNKESDFLKWGSSLINKFKNEFLKKNVLEDNYYYSDNAIQWIKENKAYFLMDCSGWKAQR